MLNGIAWGCTLMFIVAFLNVTVASLLYQVRVEQGSMTFVDQSCYVQAGEAWFVNISEDV